MGIIGRLKSMVGLKKEAASVGGLRLSLQKKKPISKVSLLMRSRLRIIIYPLSGSFSDTFPRGVNQQMSSGRKKSKR